MKKKEVQIGNPLFTDVFVYNLNIYKNTEMKLLL